MKIDKKKFQIALTPTIQAMLQQIEDHLGVNKSDSIRLGVTEFYKKLLPLMTEE